MMSLDERLDKAEEMIQKPSFRENKGLGNEVGYYIFDYPAEKELYIRERIEYIKKKVKIQMMISKSWCSIFTIL